MQAENLARLIDVYAAPLELYARQWCDDAADVVQLAFVRLIEQEPIPDYPVPWLYRVVRNTALLDRRSNQRRRRHETNAADGAADWFVPSVEDAIDSKDAARALGELPAEQREVVIARLWGGLTFLQIGELMDTSSSTAHRRYEDALCILRKRLGVSCPNSK